jgi:hypothetical protein
VLSTASGRILPRNFGKEFNSLHQQCQKANRPQHLSKSAYDDSWHYLKSTVNRGYASRGAIAVRGTGDLLVSLVVLVGRLGCRIGSSAVESEWPKPHRSNGKCNGSREMDSHALEGSVREERGK